MQFEARKYEETPSIFWGLDPVFLAFAKLYIRDILKIKESEQVPGVFLYNGHPIKQVDILGTVIGMKEREAFFIYGVDDSTGVINCICWKNERDSKTSPAGTQPCTARGLNVTTQLKKLQEVVRQKTTLEIGDVIRIRGQIRVYRDQREIQASTYYKVNDPVWDVQIARMLELPNIYRKMYDQPFQIPGLMNEKALSNPSALDLPSLTVLLSEKVNEFLMEHKVLTFYPRELETVDTLLSLANQPVIRGICPEQVDSTKGSISKSLHSIFKEAIQLLLERGIVFQKSDSLDDLYYVTEQDKELQKKILSIIQGDCQKPKHAERGCHFLHILACVRQNYNPHLSEATVHQVLDLLENRSDVVSTMEGYYTVF
ncbi:CST complex subunit STN1 isoform X1 [Tachyglossus aculeatus]|uniref:CST complex subunit STN1 isoform X1 n=1 Tax=Tachyglossus aculeatus TaxID=9261 RepID=UPI0018F6ED88|nr:CST complex subunit STN1 isoform X1 [Tachyglossus aculeatus]XP_038613896.1 CST complex subunit STN1 isoform X1 [Tachyglossus aculeatus]XP_038613897.1 CST complex subunit STN1 isoform X1 [Tachyglossus aculeatus]XP_038613898.1 CST complex subunit STN1 isoform X1 [Tachyglossus aculeatus]